MFPPHPALRATFPYCQGKAGDGRTDCRVASLLAMTGEAGERVPRER